MSSTNRSMITPRFLLGVFLVLLGISWTLDQIGLLSSHHFVRFWPVGLIIIGLAWLQRGDKQAVLRAIVLIVIGTWLLLNTLHLVDIDIWEFIWPLLLVYLGARIIVRQQRGGDGFAPQSSIPSAPGATSAAAQPATSPHGADHASLFSLLSSTKRRWGNAIFRSAEATVILGGCELDLRDALIGASDTAVIEVFVVMGGISIRVPPHWTVTQDLAPILGGVEDDTRTMPSTPAQHLIVRGTVIMGGIDISN